MKRILLAALLGVFLLAGCMVRSGYRGEAVIVPALPSIVVVLINVIQGRKVL